MRSVPAFVQKRQIEPFTTAEKAYGEEVRTGLAKIAADDPLKVSVTEL